MGLCPFFKNKETSACKAGFGRVRRVTFDTYRPPDPPVYLGLTKFSVSHFLPHSIRLPPHRRGVPLGLPTSEQP